MDEGLFPRGKPKFEPTTSYKKPKRHDEVTDSLFSEGNKSTSEGGSKKSTKRKKDGREGPLGNYDADEVDDMMDKQNETTVDFLHCKRVQQGTLLLGCIREIREVEMVISLPHCNTGLVQANQISEIYTNLIRKHLEGYSDDLTPLSDMFQIGDILICSALNPSGSAILPLTLYPSLINKYLSTNNFFTGQIIIGAVKSEEEHGYTINVGKPGVRAFLPVKETGGRKLPDGTVIRSVVTNVRGEGSILLLSLDEKKIAKSLITSDQRLSLDILQPGSVGLFHPTKKVKVGLIGKFLGYDASMCALDCDMDKIKLEDDWDEIFGRKPKKIRMRGKRLPEKEGTVENVTKPTNQVFKSCILFVSPMTKHIALGTSPFVLGSHSKRKFLDGKVESFPRGHKCNATVTNCIKGLGALLTTEDGTAAFCPTKHLSDEKFSDFGEILGSQTTFPARVLQSITIDGAVVLTLKKSVIESEYFSYDDIIPGSKVDCTIQSMQDNGLLVTIGKTAFSPLKGFVPKIHMADVLLHHPEKKFSKGDVITCRVMSVDKSVGRVKLTHKKTLLKSKLPVITSYDQLKRDCITHGYIASIKPYGVFVNFYNNVHGLVPNAQLSTEFLEDPEKTYFVGQVMKCRVIHCDPTGDRAKLSFVLKSNSQQADVQEIANSKTVFDVKVVEKKENGLEVLVCDDTQLKNTWVCGFLPTMHLSDFPSLAKFWYDSVTTGHILRDCLVVNRRKDLQITRKKSIVNIVAHSTEDDEIKGFLAFSDLKEGLTSCGFIHHTAEYGVFVQLPGGQVGLCPKSKMADRFLPTSEGYYKDGQSVFTKIIDIDAEKKRFLVTLRESDCQQGSEENRMEAYLTEFEEIMRMLNPSWPESFGTGKQLTVTLTGEKNDQFGYVGLNNAFPGHFTGIVCDLDDGAANLQKIKSTLLYVNPLLKQIVLSADPNFLKKIGKFKFGTSQMATVRNVNEDVSCVTVGKENQAVAALCLTRNHPNCSLFDKYFPWKVNDVIDVVMEKQISHVSIVGKKSTSRTKKFPDHSRHQRQEPEDSDAFLSGNTDFGSLQIGQEVEGAIRSVRKNELLIRFTESQVGGGYHGNPVTGRLHISELESDPKVGSFSMKKYQTWSKIKCKVIGFRDVRTHHFLAITNRNSLRCVLELSLRDNPIDLHFDDLSVGQKVLAYSTDYNADRDEITVEVTPSVKGFIPLLLLSDDPTASLKLAHKCQKPFVWNCIVQKLLRNTVIFAGNGSMIDRDTKEDITELKANCVTNGIVRKIFSTNIVVALPHGGIGKVHISDSTDDYSEKPFKKMEVGLIIRCTVLTCIDKKALVLSMRKSHLSPDPVPVKDKEIVTAQSLQPGSVVRGFVKNISKSGVFIALSRNLTGRVHLTKISKYYIHDVTVVEELFNEGRLVTCKVLNVSEIEGKVDLSLLETDTGVPDLIPEKLGLPIRHGKPPVEKKKEVGELVDKIGEKKKNKKRKLSKKQKKGDGEEAGGKKKKQESQDKDSGVDDDIHVPDSPPGYFKAAPQNDCEEDPGFSWDVTPLEAPTKLESDDSSDEEEEVVVVSKKTKREKEADKSQEEAVLRQKEEMLLEDKPPQTALDWDKLVLASPQNSMLWVSYMAFHLRSTEVENAKAVAERAIKTIDFREEKEKWNVWAALLNLENRFGSEDSLTATIDRACQHNDPLKVNFHMVSMFERSSKLESAEQLCKKMLRKFRRNKTVWMLYITHLMQRGEREEADIIFKRSLQSLEKSCHLEIISKFAQLEYKTGDPEHGRVLFENALSNYPKRADIWSIYIDMLLKTLKIEEAREVFERVITLNMSTKNMRTFFKKYIEFESKNGSDELVAEIKQKALEYIESKTTDVEE